MFRATAGVNTHKGSIFSLGLLCAAAGRSHQRGQPVTPARLCGYAAQFCRGLVARELAPCARRRHPRPGSACL